jgi:hypothetical protein
MRTCSQKNIEENLRRTEAGFHPECEPTDIDAQSPLAFNLKTGINQAGSIDRIPLGPVREQVNRVGRDFVGGRDSLWNREAISFWRD